MEYGVQARVAAERKVPSPALEKVVEANTLLSGLGFESCGLAAAHGIHNGLTVSHRTHGMMHGEKVNIGTLAQLVLEGASTQTLDTFLTFSRSVGLPTTLAEIGFAAFVAATERILEESPHTSITFHHIIAEGDTVIAWVHWKTSPHHPGYTAADMFRIADGRIVEHWDVVQPLATSAEELATAG